MDLQESENPKITALNAKYEHIEHYKKRVLIQLDLKYGNVSLTCQACQISRTTFYSYYNNDDAFKECVDDISEAILDIAETKLFQAVNAGELAAIFFTLKTKGKKRGYVEKQEHEHSGQIKTETVTLFELPKNGRDENT